MRDTKSEILGTAGDVEAACAGFEGCHELEGVMYDFFVHDPACPKSPEQQRLRAEAGEPKPVVCRLCGHNNLSVDGHCRESVNICSDGYHGTRECGHTCDFGEPKEAE